MEYLLDTHVVLWWLTEPKKISAKAHKLISNRKNEVYVSSVSLWEMAIKKEIGRLTLPLNLLSVLAAETFQILPLKGEEALGVIDLPNLHPDPFDRILIAQAKFNDLVLITRDQKMLGYPIVTLKA